MGIITLTSDFGEDSHYLVSVKAVLLSGNKDVRVLDISNNIERFDINEAAYLINLVRNDFPPDTIHIIAVDTENYEGQRILCVKFKEQFFIIPDNGLMSLIEPGGKFEIFEIALKDNENFLARDVMAKQALSLITNNYQADKIFRKTETLNKKLGVRPVIQNDKLQGTIAYIDSYGNAFTNVTKKIFEDFVKTRKFSIVLSYFESVEKIHQKFSEVSNGQTVCLFDENGYLMIRINQGSASQLYNLRKSKPIMIELL